jgi:hypothetical protein
MKRVLGLIIVIGVWSIAVFNLVTRSPVTEARAETQSRPASMAAAVPENVPGGVAVATVAPTCANPTPEMIADCAERAEKVLATTVRLEFHGPSGGIGHATVINGRYLVTHNHYPISGEELSRGGEGLISAVSVFKANGDIILLKTPLSYFTVLTVEPEVLVLDFKEYGGIGFFETLGVPSATMRTWDGLSLRPGSEVAQVDWDGSTAHVEWTRVAAIHAEGESPYIELDSFVEQGSSGGGVYYVGYHIANNWSRLTIREAETGEIITQFSTAALDTATMLP